MGCACKVDWLELKSLRQLPSQGNTETPARSPSLAAKRRSTSPNHLYHPCIWRFALNPASSKLPSKCPSSTLECCLWSRLSSIEWVLQFHRHLVCPYLRTKYKSQALTGFATCIWRCEKYCLLCSRQEPCVLPVNEQCAPIKLAHISQSFWVRKSEIGTCRPGSTSK